MTEEVFSIICVIVAFLVAFGAGFSLYAVDWSVHKDMTKKNSKIQTTVSYKEFKRYFNTVQWDQNSTFRGSLWDITRDSEYHANIIRVNGMGLLLRNPIEHSLAKNYVRQFIARGMKPPATSDKKKTRSKFHISRRPDNTGYTVSFPDGTDTFVAMNEIYKDNSN